MRFSPTRVAELRADLHDLRKNPRLATFVRDEIEVVERALESLEREDATEEQQLETLRAQFEETVELAKKRYDDAVQFDSHYFKKKH